MTGNFIDTFKYNFKKKSVLKKLSQWNSNIVFIKTNFGVIRVLDTKGDKPVIINAPDGPNTIEHHEELILELSKNFRVICFEFPGIGYSYPTSQFDYSLENGANLILDLMKILKVDDASLSFSCSNGLYAIKAVDIAPKKVNHLFLAQTPSHFSMIDWAEINIPKVLRIPIVGQLINPKIARIMANKWHKIAIPTGKNVNEFRRLAVHSLDNGGCFCLASLVQGLSKKNLKNILSSNEVHSTLVWGTKDVSHKKTDCYSIHKHLPNCNVVEFNNCGHFPELEDTAQYVSLLNKIIFSNNKN